MFQLLARWWRGESRGRRGPKKGAPARTRPALEALEGRCLPSIYTVLNTGDNNGVDPAPNAGTGTLRQAIVDANSHYNTTSSAPDRIEFNLPTSDPHYNAATATWTIAPTARLPGLTDPVVLDGYTQPGSSKNTLASGSNARLKIVLSGEGRTLPNGTGFDGLVLATHDSTVQGLVINRFSGHGIVIIGPTSSNNRVLGNYIGTNAAGDAALGNGGAGVHIYQAPNNFVGSPSPADRNVLSGNRGDGVFIAGFVDFSTLPPVIEEAPGNQVQGNYIGTNAQGTAALGNASAGVNLIDVRENTVGGTTAGAHNVLSANLYGVHIFGTFSYDNHIEGNYIGTDASGGTSASAPGVGNSQLGVYLRAGGNFVGGTAAGAGNVISGNSGHGLYITASRSRVEGNYIGTDASGTRARPNLQMGVLIEGGANNTIGGTVAGAGNVISANASHGVQVTSGVGNRIQQNAIFANGQLGINLVGGTENKLNGVTANDAGDGDRGPNFLQNYPELTRALLSSTSTSITGTLRSTPGQTFTVEFFASAVADPSGFGEGQTFLGALAVTTDAVTGVANFTAKVRPSGGRSIITATATDAAGNTSEFSRAIQAT